MTVKVKCFGFYNDSPTCHTCMANKRCRAIMISDGGDIIEALLDELLAADPGHPFTDTDRPSEMVSQLLNPSARQVALQSEGVIAELFGDNPGAGGPFGASAAAAAGADLSEVGKAMTRRDVGELPVEEGEWALPAAAVDMD